MHLSYAREKIGHALIGFRQWIPEEQVKDVRAFLRMALPLGLKFLTKGELVLQSLFHVGYLIDADGVTDEVGAAVTVSSCRGNCQRG